MCPRSVLLRKIARQKLTLELKVVKARGEGRRLYGGSLQATRLVEDTVSRLFEPVYRLAGANIGQREFA